MKADRPNSLISVTLNTFHLLLIIYLHVFLTPRTDPEAEGEILMSSVLLVLLFSPSRNSEWLVMYSSKMSFTAEVR